MKKTNFSKNLDNIYSLMANAYEGNWTYRWDGTPYFDIKKTGKTESIIGHEWSCGLFWMNIRKICPALDKLVDTVKIYEIFLIHDLGETHLGDISRFQQLQGKSVDKHILERQAVDLMTKQLTKNSRNRILTLFDSFESKHDETTNLEVLITKLIDSIQGDHFCMTFGHDLVAHSNIISRIVNKHTVPCAKRLIEVLEKKGEAEAKEEVKQIFWHHINVIKSTGIILDTDGYPK